MTKHVDLAAIRQNAALPMPFPAADYERVGLLQAFADAISNPGEHDDGAGGQALAEQTVLIERLILAPALSKEDAAAKVRMLIEHVMPANWRGPDAELDWDIAMARRLLLSLAGLDPLAG